MSETSNDVSVEESEADAEARPARGEFVRGVSGLRAWIAALVPAGLFATAALAEATQEFPACDVEFEITEPTPKLLWTPNATTLVARKLADGVFAVLDSRAGS